MNASISIISLPSNNNAIQYNTQCSSLDHLYDHNHTLLILHYCIWHKLAFYDTLGLDFLIFITPNAAIIAPMTVRLPPSPIILLEFSVSAALVTDIIPPMIIKIPVTINIIPNTLYGGFFDMKNALPYPKRTWEKLANICCNVISNGNFNKEDKTDYLTEWNLTRTS